MFQASTILNEVGKILLIACLLLAAGCTRKAATVEDKIWVGGVDWKQVPDEEPTHKYSDGTVLQFLPNGEFRLVECHLIAFHGHVGISRGDGYGRHAGTWKPTTAKGQIEVRYRLDTPTRLVSQPRVTGPWKTATIQVLGPDLLQMGNTNYRPNTEIDLESLDFVLRN